MPDLRTRALGLLARREHSRAELRSKLAGHAESEDEVERLLDALASERLLSDERYASQRVALRSCRYGNARLKLELRSRGVADEALAGALNEAGDETERCRAVWQKKFGVPATGAEEKARQMRFLQSRGFPVEAIRKVVSGEDE